MKWFYFVLLFLFSSIHFGLMAEPNQETALILDNNFISQPGITPLIIHNSGAVPVHIQNISFAPKQSHGLSVEGLSSCIKLLAPGASCSLSVNAAITAEGQGTLTLTTDTSSVPFNFPVAIDGQALEINNGQPVMLAPGETIPVTVTNTGTFALNNFALAATTLPVGVTIRPSTVNACGAMLAPKSSCTVLLSANNSTALGQVGQLSLSASNFNGQSQRVTVAMTGSLTMMAMPKTHLRYVDIRLSNNSDAAISINNIDMQQLPKTVMLSHNPKFSTTCTVGASLNQMQTCDIWLHANNNKTVGIQTGVLTIQARIGSTLKTYRFRVTNTTNLYAGGYFDFDGTHTIPLNNIAQWNGSTWAPLIDSTSGNNGISGNVRALALGDSDLYVGGEFNLEGTRGLVIWNGSNWQDLAGGSLGSNPHQSNTTVYALALDQQGNLYVGGDFNEAGSTAVSNIAESSNGVWSAVGSGFNKQVRALLMVGTSLYAGGQFTASSSDSPLSHIAVWQGNTWQPLGNGLSGYAYPLDLLPEVSSLAADTRGNVYVSGNFNQAGTAPPSNGIAVWSPSSQVWLNVSNNPSLTYTNDIMVDPEGNVYIAGIFNTSSDPNGITGANIEYEPGTKTWNGLDGGANCGAEVPFCYTPLTYAMLVDGNDNFYMAGSMQEAGWGENQVDVYGVAEWSNNTWTAVGNGIDNEIFAMVMAPDLSVSPL